MPTQAQAVDVAGRAGAHPTDDPWQALQDAEAAQAQQGTTGSAGVGLRIVTEGEAQAGELRAGHKA